MKILYIKTKNKTIKSKINELYHSRKKLARLYQNIPKDNKELENYKESIEETKKNISKLEIWLNSKSSIFYTKNINYKQISKHLKPNEVYIDFAKTEMGYFVFTLDKKNQIIVEKFDINQSKIIDTTIKEILNEKERRISQAQKKYNKLYNLIFEKINIKNKTSLIISPDGLLNAIPFEAFYDGEKYLIEKLNIKYIPSGKELVKLYNSKNISNNKVVVFANPTFGLSVNKNNSSQLKGNTIESLYNQAKKDNSVDNYFGTLNNSNEPKIIKKLYGKNAQIYLGKDATESNFFKIKSPKILHLSTHGFYLKDKSILNPMLKAGIALSGANNSIKNRKGDGIITALELSGMDLSHTELVVLSACETNVGEIDNGEGVAGMSKAFMKAGAKYIVMSLWNVPEKSTAELMERFYENLHKGYSYSRALRKAKIWMIKNKNAHPFYWSGFVGSGRDKETDFTKASQYFQKICDANMEEGCYNLGVMYHKGIGIKQDYSMAIKFYTKACNENYLDGCSNLGVLYEKGQGTKKNFSKAVNLYTKACNGNDAEGCYNLGNIIYFNNKGTDKNNSKTKEAWIKACNIGNFTGCSSLGTIYAENKNYAKAISLDTKACSNNNTMGCNNLGFMYESGDTIPKDEPKAVKFYDKACNGGLVRGCYNLAIKYERGEGVAKDYTKAVNFYKQACIDGHMTACSNLGLMYSNGKGVNKNFNKAVELFTKACNGNCALGCSNLGMMYSDGEGVKKDFYYAMELYKKACDGGNALGCNNLGTMYANGEGVKEDFNQAKKLFKKACDGGETLGCRFYRMVIQRVDHQE